MAKTLKRSFDVCLHSNAFNANIDAISIIISLSSDSAIGELNVSNHSVYSSTTLRNPTTRLLLFAKSCVEVCIEANVSNPEFRVSELPRAFSLVSSFFFDFLRSFFSITGFTPVSIIAIAAPNIPVNIRSFLTAGLFIKGWLALMYSCALV